MENYSMKKLRAIASYRKIKNYAKYNKAELLAQLFPKKFTVETAAAVVKEMPAHLRKARKVPILPEELNQNNLYLIGFHGVVEMEKKDAADIIQQAKLDEVDDLATLYEAGFDVYNHDKVGYTAEEIAYLNKLRKRNQCEEKNPMIHAPTRYMPGNIKGKFSKQYENSFNFKGSKAILERYYQKKVLLMQGGVDLDRFQVINDKEVGAMSSGDRNKNFFWINRDFRPPTNPITGDIIDPKSHVIDNSPDALSGREKRGLAPYTEEYMKHRIASTRDAFYNDLMFRTKKIPRPTTVKENILNIKRGYQEINYVPGETQAVLSCFIDALIESKYTKMSIVEAFPNYWDKEFRVSANDIIKFVESKKGQVHFYDLFNKTIYKSPQTNNNSYKVLSGILNHEHFTLISDPSLKKRFANLALRDNNKRTVGFVETVAPVKPITKKIVCAKTDRLTMILREHIHKDNIKDNKGLPKVRFCEDSLYQVETHDTVYINMNQCDIDHMRAINNFDSLDTFAALGLREFAQYKQDFNKKAIEDENPIFDNEGQILPNLLDILSSLSIGPKTYKFPDIDDKPRIALQCIDQNKSYSHTLKSCRIFKPSCVSKINRYVSKEKHEPGVYNVMTEDMFLFRGNGHYTDRVLDLAIKEGIPFTCDWYINFEAVVSPHYRRFTESILMKYGDKIGNRIIGNFIGASYRKKHISTKTTMSFDPFDAHYYYDKYDATIRDFHKETSLYDIYDKPLYLISRKEVTDAVHTTMGVFIEVINNSHIANYLKMKQIGLDLCAYISTDAIGIMHNNPMPGLCANIVGAYKAEAVNNNKPLWENKEIRSIDIPDDITWNMVNIDEENPITTSVCVQGAAGSGKTSLVHKLLQGLKVVKLSPTNAAARKMEGETFSSYFNSNFISLSSAQVEILKTMDAIWVDEISMCNRLHYTILALVKNALPSLKIILSGDFRQLQPVLDNLDYQNSDNLKALTDNNLCMLTKVYRYDFKYDEVVLDDDMEANTELFINMEKPRAIVVTNQLRNELNSAVLKKLGLRSYGHYAIGMPLVCHTNLRSKKYTHYNNVMYTVVNCGYAKEMILYNHITEKLEYYDMYHVMKYFNLGYACTTYKSQGQTWDHPYVIFESDIMNENHRYVAVTRSTKLGYILNASI